MTTSRREKGSVAITRITETRVRMKEQIPGPSSHPPALTEPEPEHETGIALKNRECDSSGSKDGIIKWSLDLRLEDRN